MSLLLALTGAANGSNYGVRSLGSISGITWGTPFATSMKADNRAVTGSTAELTATGQPASGSVVTYRRLGSLDLTLWTGGVLSKSMALAGAGQANPGAQATLTTAIKLVATGDAKAAGTASLTPGVPVGGSGAGVTFSYRGLGLLAPTSWLADGLPSIALTASGAARPSGSATLFVGIGLVAGVSAKPVSTAVLTTAIPLAALGRAAPSGAGTIYAGPVAPGVAMSYRRLGLVSVAMWTGDGIPATWITAGGAAIPATSASLTTKVQLLAVGAAQPTGAASLTALSGLVGQGAAKPVGSASLTTVVRLVAGSGASPVGLGALGSTIALTGANAATPSSSAVLAVPGGLTASSGAARPSSSADLTTTVAMVAAKAAATQVTADLLTAIRLSSSTAALALGSANLGTRIALLADNAAFCVSAANLTTALLTDIRAHGQANPSSYAVLTLIPQLKVNPCRVVYGGSLLRSVIGEPLVRDVIGTCCTTQE